MSSTCIGRGISLRSAVSIAACSLLLAACGGGGGGADGNARAPTGSITFSSTSLAFTTNDIDVQPHDQAVTATVTGVSADTLFIRIVLAGDAVGAVSAVVITGPTTGSSTVTPASAILLGPGQHTGTITVSACTTDINCTSGHLRGSPQTINVTFTVNGIVVPQIDSFTVENDPTQATQSRVVAVNGYPAQPWTATSSVPWLTVTPSGMPGSNATISLVTSQVNAMLNGTYPARVTFTPGVGAPVVREFAMTIARTQVNYVSSYLSLANTPTEVIIRGEGFNKATLTGVRFGNLPADSFELVNDTQIRATHPALTAGTYDVHLQSSVAARELAQLVVVEPRTYPSTTLTFPDGPDHTAWGSCYDEERRSLYVVSRQSLDYSTEEELRRFTFDGSSWSSEAVAMPRLQDCTLSTDGKELILVDHSEVLHVDPATLQVVRTTPFAQRIDQNYKVVTSNDGYVYTVSLQFDGLFRYSTRNHTLETLTSSRDLWSNLNIAASQDGSRIFAGHPFYRIDTVTNTMSRMLVGFGGQLVVDRTGSRILVEEAGVRVLDADMVQLGRLEQDFSTSIVATAINGDGTRAYVLLRGDRKLHIYDLTSPPVNGLFTQIGTGVSVPDLAIDGAGRSEMHLSKDEHTLFIVGGAGVVVHGLP